MADLSFRSGFQVRYIGQGAIRIVDQLFSCQVRQFPAVVSSGLVSGLVLSGFGVRHLSNLLPQHRSGTCFIPQNGFKCEIFLSQKV